MSLVRGKTNNTFDVISGDFNGESLPVGAMIPFPSDTIPYGWLLCNGQAVSRIDYADLFAVVGTSHGSGDGSTTFNVPDMRDYTVVGKSATDTNLNAIGKKYGAKTHTLTIDQMPSHDHPSTNGALSWVSTDNLGTTWWLTANGFQVTAGQINTNNDGIKAGWMGNTEQVMGTKGGGQAHNNMQPSIAENYIIKAKQSSGVIAEVIDDLNSTSTVDALSANQGKNIKDNLTQQDITTDGAAVKCGYKIDGRDVYVKRIYLGYLPNAGSKSVAHGISNFGLVVDIRGVMKDVNTGAQSKLPYVITSVSSSATQYFPYQIGFDVSDTNIIVYTGKDRTSNQAWVDLFFIYAS